MKKHLILIKTTDSKTGVVVTGVWFEDTDEPLNDINKIEGTEVVHREDLIISDDGIIRWRSGMDAGSPEPWIGQQISDFRPKKHFKV